MQQEKESKCTASDPSLLHFMREQRMPSMTGLKPSGTSGNANPKDLLGVKKCSLRFVPPALQIMAAPAMANGAVKYGPYNWRANPVLYSVYLEAIQRHLLALQDGEDMSLDANIHHLSHIAANIAILADCLGLGNLIDDRPQPGPAAKLLAEQDKSRG